MANRIEATVKMTNIYSYTRPAYVYGYETAYIYTMTAEDGKVYVWKTTALMGIEIPDENGWIIYDEGKKKGKYAFVIMRKGDVVKIKATFKAEGEYKGQPQTEVARVKVTEVVSGGKTPEQIEAERLAKIEAKKQEQMASLAGDDFIWKQMPYKQYKEHYSDCETVCDSFEKIRFGSYIDVIIREGRLKESGVRGQHYNSYECTNSDGMKVTYKAVCEDNAIRRAEKEFGGEGWVCTHIY